MGASLAISRLIHFMAYTLLSDAGLLRAGPSPPGTAATSKRLPITVPIPLYALIQIHAGSPPGKQKRRDRHPLGVLTRLIFVHTTFVVSIAYKKTESQ